MSVTAAHTRPVKLNGFERVDFTTSRSLEYFSEKELTLQTGHGPEEWPGVVLKELVDNALDAAEQAGVAPKLKVISTPESLTVSDNGPGIAPDTIDRILDFSSKTSSKDYYVSPTRGAQGNALKTVLAVPYVLSGGKGGRVEIESRSVRHVISVAVDRIRQEPNITHEKHSSIVKSGTIVKVAWPEIASSEPPIIDGRFLQQLDGFSLLNPHASITIDGKAVDRATNRGWQK